MSMNVCPTGSVCLPTDYYMLLMFFFISITLFYMYKMQNIDLKLGINDYNTSISKNMEILDDVPIFVKKSRKTESALLVNDMEKRLYLEDRDKQAVVNDFKPPERRLPEHAYPDQPIKNALNIPTRGLPDNYQAVGALVRKSDEKILQLYGRQKYPGSNQWEYYVAGGDSYGFPNKMPIGVRGDKELEDKQKIEVPFLDKSKGDFEVNIFNYDAPRYNPYDY